MLPQWNNTDEYQSFQAPEFQEDIRFIEVSK